MSDRHAVPLSLGERGRGEGGGRDGLREFARRLRANLTDAEQRLWYRLRDRRFMGLKFRRQYPSPPYVLDFYCEELKLAVELDGGQHNEDAKRRLDGKRSATLSKRGITVARYWNDEVLVRVDDVMNDLSTCVARLRSRPSSGASRHLLPTGEGTP